MLPLTDEQKHRLMDLRAQYGHAYKTDRPLGPFADAITEYVESLIAQAEDAAVERQWQPIETAPKDGRQILTIDEAEHYAVLCWESYTDTGGQWEDDDGEHWTPTHWQHLPKSPTDCAATIRSLTKGGS